MKRRPIPRMSFSIVPFSFIMVFFLIFLIQTAPCTNGAGTDTEMRSGSSFNYYKDGTIERFTIWIEFPEPIDTDLANSSISLYVPGNQDWTLDSSDFPYYYQWSMNDSRVEIDSGSVDLSDDDIHSLTVTISTPIRSKDGALLWEDRSEINLAFGNINDLDFGYSPIEILITFFLPFFILVLVLIGIEMILRFIVKERKEDSISSSSETLLRLIDKSDRWLRRRMIITMFLTFLVVLAYISIVLIALINAMFAMVMTWIIVLFLTPWVILIITSCLFFFFRKEDLTWRKKLKTLRGQQQDFLQGLEQE